MMIILANALTNQEFSKWTVGSLIPSVTDDLIAPLRVQSIVLGFAGVAGIIQALYCFINVLSYSQEKPRIKSLLGSIPVFMFIGAMLLVIYTSEWATANPGYLILLFTPAYSMISSKQIVCNFTGMKLDVVPKSFLWASLFLVNRVASVVSLQMSCKGDQC